MRPSHWVRGASHASDRPRRLVPVVSGHERGRVAFARSPPELLLGAPGIDDGILTQGTHVVPLRERGHSDELEGAEHGAREHARNETEARAGPGMVDQALQVLPDGPKLACAEVEDPPGVTGHQPSDPVGELVVGQELISIAAMPQHWDDAATPDQLEQDREGPHTVRFKECLGADDGYR